MGNIYFIWTVVLLVGSSTCIDPIGIEDRVVYPRFLEARSNSGSRTLKLTDDLVLNLQQHSAYGNELLIRTIKKDGTDVHEYVSASNFNDMLFQDEAKMASVAIMNQNGLHVRGVIGDTIRIKPLLTAERSEDGIVPHLLYEADDSDEGAHRYAHVPGPMVDEAVNSFRGLRVEQRADAEMRPEIHVFVDNVYFRRFNFNRDEVVLYLGAALLSMNLRYKTIRELKIRLCIVGFTFYEDQQTERTFLRKIRGTRHNDMVATLGAFKEHYRTKDLFHSVDILILVSGRDYCMHSNGRLDCLVKGVAYIAGACTDSRMSITKDTPWSFDIIRVMAHEVGHSLGCVHDGEGPFTRVWGHPGARDCPWSLGYIMSYVTRDKKVYQFSPCCARQIKHVTALRPFQCLFQNNSHREEEKSRSLPGFVVTQNTLCNITFGKGGRTFIYDSTQQRGECLIPCRSERPREREQDKYYYGFVRAVDGTNCTPSGSEICIAGSCVPRKKRPTTTSPEHGKRRS